MDKEITEKINILKEAERIIKGNSSDTDFGHERSMPKIVNLYKELTGKEFTEHDGYMFMICLKLIRMQKNPKIADNYIDLAGYTQLASEANAEVKG